jgi:hypothetical protein
LIDKSYEPDYANYSEKLPNLVNGHTGGDTFEVYDYGKMTNRTKNPPTIKDDYKTTNIMFERIVIPDSLERYPSPSIIDMVVNHGIQITLYPFYTYSDNLVQYELLFNEYKSAIIPMAYAITYLSRLEKELSVKKIQIGAL